MCNLVANIRFLRVALATSANVEESSESESLSKTARMAPFVLDNFRWDSEIALEIGCVQ